MDEGIKSSRFGLVFISTMYPQKHWTKQELAGLRAREALGQLTVLPVLLGVDIEFVTNFVPALAGVSCINTKNRSEIEIAFDIIQIVRPELAEFMHANALFKKQIEKSKPEKVNLSEVQKGPIIHDHFSVHVHSRIRLLQACLEDVFDSDIDEWLDNFSRDWHPHRELIWWEFIASLYFKMKRIVSPYLDDKTIFNDLIRFIEYKDPTGVRSWSSKLPDEIDVRAFNMISDGQRVYSAIFSAGVSHEVFQPKSEDA